MPRPIAILAGQQRDSIRPSFFEAAQGASLFRKPALVFQGVRGAPQRGQLIADVNQDNLRAAADRLGASP